MYILAAFIDYFKGQGTGLMIVHRISMRGKMASVYRLALLLRAEYERMQHGNDYFELKMRGARKLVAKVGSPEKFKNCRISPI